MQYRLECSLRIGEVFSELVLFCPQVVSLLRARPSCSLGPRARAQGSPARGLLAGGGAGGNRWRLREGGSPGRHGPPDAWAPGLVPRCSPKS